MASLGSQLTTGGCTIATPATRCQPRTPELHDVRFVAPEQRSYGVRAVIERLRLLRNVGVFDSVDAGAKLPLAALTLVYAENGRGKTTLAAIFRSVATGDAVPVTERHRLGSPHPAHVVLDVTGQPPVVFENNAWNQLVPNIAIFDDRFVDENLYSGLLIEPAHRQNLHELILGAAGVTLNVQLQQLVSEIELHNTALREKAAAIPAADSGALSVDDFCALQPDARVAEELETAERQLRASRDQDSIRDTPLFDMISLPPFDVAAITALLRQDVGTLDATAAARVEAHLAVWGEGAEEWVAEGMRRVSDGAAGASTGTCPFCAQELASSPVIPHYRAYFSDAYRDLKDAVAAAQADLVRIHGGDVVAGFERDMRVAGVRRQFWSQFVDVPDLNLDTGAIAAHWRAAREEVSRALSAKQGAPLEPLDLPGEASRALAVYAEQQASVVAAGRALEDANPALRLVKERALAGDRDALEKDVARLKATQARHTPPTNALCAEYLAEKDAKSATQQRRDSVKASLEQYRAQVFPSCQTAINQYLARFNAGFHINHMNPMDTRGGPTCTYNVVINDVPVAVAGGEPAPGQPSFRNTLSAGDRSALALAFFFASLDQDPGRAEKIVIIDDPASSQDDYRSLTTTQEIRGLAERVRQTIVLSHSKRFLCGIWEHAHATTKAAIQVTRDGAGSTILRWDVDQDSVTEHDRRHAVLVTFLTTGAGDTRSLAQAIRPHMEAFLRVAYPGFFPPVARLRQFRAVCETRVGTPDQVLGAEDTQELGRLLEYANRFHHDTNPAWETAVINDGELRGFVERALRFAQRCHPA